MVRLNEQPAWRPAMKTVFSHCPEILLSLSILGTMAFYISAAFNLA
jgi:hypothetical protein